MIRLSSGPPFEHQVVVVLSIAHAGHLQLFVEPGTSALDTGYNCYKGDPSRLTLPSQGFPSKRGIFTHFPLPG